MKPEEKAAALVVAVGSKAASGMLEYLNDDEVERLAGEVAKIDSAEVSKGTLFPHEIPSDHWDADFGDSKQVYQGSDLPIWILAGWAAFIIWAVVYLVSGLPTAF